MIRPMKTPAQHATAGRAMVLAGKLPKLRKKIGLTRSAMAELLHMSIITYTRCETMPHTAGTMRQTTAERLGRFAFLAERTILELRRANISVVDMTPLHVVATTHGLPQELLMKWHREGVIQTEDLGILGLWIHNEDLHYLKEAV